MHNAGIYFRTFLVEHVKEFGSIPLWNPRIFCGLPFVDAFHGDIFYPLSFLKYFGDTKRMIDFTMIMHIMIAGIAAYGAARQFRLSKLASTVAGVAYMYSGWLNSLMAPGHDGKIFVTALFPLTILFLDRAFEKNRFLNFTLLGIVIGLIILTPHVQLAYYTLWALAGYTIFKLIFLLKDSKSIKPLVTPGCLTVYAVLIGVLLSAIQMFPGYKYTRTDSMRKENESRYAYATAWSLHPEEAIALAVPEFCGTNDLFNNKLRYWGRNPFKDNSETPGLIPLILGMIGLICGRGRIKYYFGILAVGALLFALADHTPFFKWCYYLIPLVKSTRAPSMIMFLFSFAVSILAAVGVQYLQTGTEIGNLRRRLAKSVLFILPAIFLFGALLYTFAPAETHQLYLKLAGSEILGDENKLAYGRLNYPAIKTGFQIAFAMSLITAAIVLLRRKLRLGMVILWILPLIIMTDGIRFSQQFISTYDGETAFGITPEIEYVRNNAGLYRTATFGIDEVSNHYYYHGIMSPIGNHGNQLMRYNRLLYHHWNWNRNRVNPRFAALVGVKYIIVPDGTELADLGYREGELDTAAVFDNIKVVENKACFPRAYLAGKYKVFADNDSLYQSIYSGDDDLRRTIYFMDDPGIDIDSIISPLDTAEIVYYGIDSVVIGTECTTGKILTLNDNYYKDWHVFVDGKEQPPLITYSTFRGVALAPGKHTVVWKYIPSSYNTGKTVSLATMAYLFIALVGYGIYRRKRRK